VSGGGTKVAVVGGAVLGGTVVAGTVVVVEVVVDVDVVVGCVVDGCRSVVVVDGAATVVDGPAFTVDGWSPLPVAAPTPPMATNPAKTGTLTRAQIGQLLNIATALWVLMASHRPEDASR